MKRHKAFRVRLYPTADQVSAFTRIAGCCRLVYNLGLVQRRDFWRQHRRVTGKSISWFRQKRELVGLKAEAPFLKEVPAHCLQAALGDLNDAYARFFDGQAGYPNPRRKFEHDSFTFPDPAQIRVDRTRQVLVLPKFGRSKKDCGPIRAVFHRPITGAVRRVTISRDGCHWYASILTATRLRAHAPGRVGLPDTEIPPAAVIGIDRGVATPVATSDGGLFGTASETVRRLRKQRRLSKALSRTQRGSKRRHKALLRLRAHKARTARRRRAMIHSITASIAKNHRVVVIEKLRVRTMTASASGTVEAPGRNVRAKSGLNRSILDKGWGEMRRQLGYKLAWNGGRLIEVPARDTSRTCGRCGTIDADSRVDRDRFVCRSCGHQDHADINAAVEIRRRGLVSLGLGLEAPDLPPAGTVGASRGALCSGMAAKREEQNDGISRRHQTVPA